MRQCTQDRNIFTSMEVLGGPLRYVKFKRYYALRSIPPLPSTCILGGHALPVTQRKERLRERGGQAGSGGGGGGVSWTQ
jgi:hypothetical protein